LRRAAGWEGKGGVAIDPLGPSSSNFQEQPRASIQGIAGFFQMEREQMDLDQFVKDSLVAIFAGTAEAQEAVSKMDPGGDPKFGPRINPCPRTFVGMTDLLTADRRLIQRIGFDVAVTAGNSSGAGAKVTVFGAGFDVGGKKENSSVSRITFSVPIVFGYQGAHEEDDHR
jgi:hypothetical protein